MSTKNIACKAQVGDELPELKVKVTRKMIIMGATSSRDWQPIHHDKSWATENAGLPDIIMNNYTQAGWISRYVTDWGGPQARLGRLKFSMRHPICPGDEAVFQGKVSTVEKNEEGLLWLSVDVLIKVDERLASKGSVRLAIPINDAVLSPWAYPAARWQP